MTLLDGSHDPLQATAQLQKLQSASTANLDGSHHSLQETAQLQKLQRASTGNFSSRSRESRKQHSETVVGESLCGEPIAVLFAALQGALLSVSFTHLGLTGSSQLSRWSKCLGRFGVSIVQASDLFEFLDTVKTGLVTPEDFLEVDLGKADFKDNLTPTMTVLQFLKLRYQLFLMACRAGLDLTERAYLDHLELVGSFHRLGLIIDEHDAELFVTDLLKRQATAVDTSCIEIQVAVLCHQLAIEGTNVRRIDCSAMWLVRHRLLQALYMTVDANGTASVKKDEYIEALLAQGWSEADADELFESLIKTSNGDSKEDLTMQQFCKAMSMDDAALSLFRSSGSSRSAISFNKLRRRLLAEAFKRAGIEEEKELEYHEFIGVLGRLQVDQQVTSKIFLLLDVNHNGFLSINEVEHLLHGRIYSNNLQTPLESYKNNLAQKPHEDAAKEYASLYDAWTLNSRIQKNFSKATSGSERERTRWGMFKRMVLGKQFTMLIGLLIAVNAITIGVETDTSAVGGELPPNFSIAEQFFTAAFLIEAAMKITVLGREYFKDVSNLFDFSLVWLSMIDVWFLNLFVSQEQNELQKVSVLRISRMLRVVKVVRVMKMFRELRLLVDCLTAGIKTLGWTMVILVILIYVCGMFATTLMAPIGDSESDSLSDLDDICVEYQGWYLMDDYYGTVGKSMITMFQVMTLDTWASSVTRPSEKLNPYSWIFFVAFMCFSNFACLNLLKGMFLEHTMSFSKEDTKAEMERSRKYRLKQMARLTDLFEAANCDDTDELTLSEFQQLNLDPNVVALFRSIGFEPSELTKLFDVLDVNKQGFVDLYEFTNGLMMLKREVKVADLIHISVQNQRHSKALVQLQQKIVQFEDMLTRHTTQRTESKTSDSGAGTFSPGRFASPRVRSSSPRSARKGSKPRANDSSPRPARKGSKSRANDSSPRHARTGSKSRAAHMEPSRPRSDSSTSIFSAEIPDQAWDRGSGAGSCLGDALDRIIEAKVKAHLNMFFTPILRKIDVVESEIRHFIEQDKMRQAAIQDRST